MGKNILIVLLLLALLAMTWFAWLMSKPVKCDDVVWDKYNQQQVCEIGL